MRRGTTIAIAVLLAAILLAFVIQFLVVDSYGLVSVALARRSAADELRLEAPTEISLEPAAG